MWSVHPIKTMRYSSSFVFCSASAWTWLLIILSWWYISLNGKKFIILIEHPILFRVQMDTCLDWTLLYGSRFYFVRELSFDSEFLFHKWCSISLTHHGMYACTWTHTRAQKPLALSYSLVYLASLFVPFMFF